jgi:bifunctional non-homologous end joining protein LigD
MPARPAFDLQPRQRVTALIDRKRVLRLLLTGIEGPIKFSEHTEIDGPTIWRRACQLGLEGIVSKRSESKYAGRCLHAGYSVTERRV